jgi:hypothetical protein
MVTIRNEATGREKYIDASQESKKDLWNDMAGSISNERNKRQNIN